MPKGTRMKNIEVEIQKKNLVQPNRYHNVHSFSFGIASLFSSPYIYIAELSQLDQAYHRQSFLLKLLILLSSVPQQVGCHRWLLGVLEQRGTKVFFIFIFNLISDC